MSPRAGLTTDAVVELAIALVDEGGPGELTLAKVADRAGVAAPSLYKHVKNLADLRRLIDLRVVKEMAETLKNAATGREGGDAVAALADAYRHYLQAHPHRTHALTAAPDQGDVELSAATHAVAEVVFAVLRPFGFDHARSVHATRCIRAAVHGFASLEASGGFGRPEDVGESFEVLKKMLVQGLTDYATNHPEKR
ncbi:MULTISPECIES: TetR/AcrR family transcriptional regulator [unclassified Amycolatopsis]|uniref:TetR/AcrR family transcriptional regulator n=1 Tax=unclassified Amycolatopsis TaxID=2618356 RepID=UPI00287622C1|nr:MULTISPECIES: TetR/AcrR family transcriptional regulator [unclassified Amycolatopsis]MDS0132250.1 TetR/AcrR family transcriptional regulator [Amycolatopsis sp. 505]MDS0142926.1 TetR/AcrR family transcriptional regulator [Amycolatopsis sp. CM201R]